MQLVIFILQVSPAPSPCCFNFVVSLATVRVGLKKIHKMETVQTCTHRHVHVVRGHVWRTLCSVCATGARVAQPLIIVIVKCNTRNFRSLDLFMSVRDVVHFKTKNIKYRVSFCIFTLFFIL